MPTVIKKLDAGAYQLKDQVVAINRVTKVVKGGKNLSFAALVVVGDPCCGGGRVRFGQGQRSSAGHSQGNRVGEEEPGEGQPHPDQIPHLVLGRFGSGRVLLKPAPEGTGVIAGGAVRAVMTSAGIQNVLTKSIGTTNPHNVIKATFDALKQVEEPEAKWPPCAARRSRSCNHGPTYGKKTEFMAASATKLRLKWVRSAICAPVSRSWWSRDWVLPG